MAEEHPHQRILAQIRNLHQRLRLVRAMQLLGILSFIFCMITMIFVYVHMQQVAAYAFFVALIMLVASLCVCAWEIQISVRALEVNLEVLKEKQLERGNKETDM